MAIHELIEIARWRKGKLLDDVVKTMRVVGDLIRVDGSSTWAGRFRSNFVAPGILNPSPEIARFDEGRFGIDFHGGYTGWKPRIAANWKELNKDFEYLSFAYKGGVILPWFADIEEPIRLWSVIRPQIVFIDQEDERTKASSYRVPSLRDKVREVYEALRTRGRVPFIEYQEHSETRTALVFPPKEYAERFNLTRLTAN